MSSTSRGTARARGRGNGQGLRGGSSARGSSASRGTSRGGFAQRGNATSRGTFGQGSRGGNGARAGGQGAKAHGLKPQPAQAGAIGGLRAKDDWAQRFERLEKARQNERKQAIRDGLIADPDKPRSLADAITPVGTCQEMCAEFERVQRVVQADVWKEEADPNHPSYGSMSQEPIEALMVKKFRRAAAGLEEQLPSDLRPPPVLKKTLDYLLGEVIGNAGALHQVHGFIWDRTRAIRNDFSIQQCTKTEDLSLAIDCYERIARFHIVSLHQLAVSPKPYDAYDPQQEREQLDRTLLSLMQYYDDARGRLPLPNEAEFRAYCVVKQLQDPTPDLEDRVQSWPREIVQDRRVRAALDLYAAACNVMDSQGPLKPRATHLVAQQDWQKFWHKINSPQVSYLMACVAEIYFNLVRRTILNALWRSWGATSRNPPTELTVEFLAKIFKLDEEDQIKSFCEAYGFNFAVGNQGEYLNLISVKGSSLPDPDRNLPRQWKSSLVEDKKFGRTIPAIINGLSVKQAVDAGLVVDEEHEEEMEDAADDSGDFESLGTNGAAAPVDDGESLFLPENEKLRVAGVDNIVTNGSLDGAPSSLGTGSVFSFGKPSGGTFGKPSEGGSIFTAQPAASTSTFGKPSGGNGIFAPQSQDAPSIFATQLGGNSIFAQKPVAPAVSTPASEPAPTATPKSVGLELPKFTPSTFSFGSQPAAPQPVEPSTIPLFNFGKNSQKQTSPDSSAVSDNEDGSPTQTFPWAAQAKDDQKATKVAPGLLDVPKQTSPDTANAMPTIGNIDQSQNDTTSTSSILQQTSKPDVKLNQPNFTPAAGSTPTPSPPTSPTQQHRKPSTSHNKPNRPSPLANSFTFEDVSNPTAFGPSPAKQRAERQQVTTPPVEDLNAIISRVAREFTLEGGGIVDQYVAFTVEKLINSVKEELELERDIRIATEYRTRVLSYRYYKKWKSVFWARRFEQRGNKRRQRARKGLEDLKRSQLSESTTTGAMGIFASSLGKSTNDGASRRSSSISSSQRPVFNGRNVHYEQQAQGGSKRPLSARAADMAAPPRENGHKRLKGLGHVDDHGRIGKPAPTTSNANADLLKRSSYLGFMGHSHATEGSSITTRDPYFRLKAMGIKSRPSIESRGLKRHHEDDDDVASKSSTSATRSRTPSFLRSSLDGKRHEDAMPPPALPASSGNQLGLQRASVASNTDEDEALFARLRAARAALSESTTFMKAEVETQEEMRRSLSASESSNESPSMARARAEARWRASHSGSPVAASTTNGADVPAYRLRESRFVPREHYGRAIERAKELRASRSRDTSRPQSRIGSHHEESGVTATAGTAPSAKQANQASAPPFAASVKSPKPFLGSSLPAWQPPATVQESSQDFFNQAHQPSFGFTDTQKSAKSPFGTINGNGNGNHLDFGSSQAPSSANFAAQISRPAHSTQDGFEQDSSSTAHQSFSRFGESSLTINGTFSGSGFLGQDAGNTAEQTKHDFTIQPEQVQQSLRTSFGSSHPAFVKPSSPVAESASARPSQQASHQGSGIIGLSSDDNDIEEQGDGTEPPYATQFAQEAQREVLRYQEDNAELLDPVAGDEEVQDSYMHSNPFSLLTNEATEGDTEEDVDEVESETVEYLDDDEEDLGDTPNGYAHEDEEPDEYQESGDGYGEDDITETADDEFDEGDDSADPSNVTGSFDQQMLAGEDEEEFESEQDFEDEEEDEQEMQGAQFWKQTPVRNEALQGVGQTEADAIELDSD